MVNLGFWNCRQKLELLKIMTHPPLLERGRPNLRKISLLRGLDKLVAVGAQLRGADAPWPLQQALYVVVGKAILLLEAFRNGPVDVELRLPDPPLLRGGPYGARALN
jgi:hypothetical protein